MTTSGPSKGLEKMKFNIKPITRENVFIHNIKNSLDPDKKLKDVKLPEKIISIGYYKDGLPDILMKKMNLTVDKISDITKESKIELKQPTLKELEKFDNMEFTKF